MFNDNEDDSQEFVDFHIPFYDLDSGEVYSEAFSIPAIVADYIQELQEKYNESELVCNAVLEASKTTKILNEVLLNNSAQARN